MSEADIKTEATADAAPDHAGEAKPFQADVSRLLDLMVHSIYSERDVFLRELISNAADACEKLRYEAIAEPQLTSDGEGFVIRVLLDKDAKTLSIVDNGIGMSRDDLDKALGTIASSGTKAFLDRIGKDAEAESGNLIGQFGIGFYSAFMVADRVEVKTRRAGSNETWRWTSDGKGAYAIASLPLDEAPTRGTRVTLHLNETAAGEYLEPWGVERLVKEHSGAVAVPIELVEKLDGEARRITDGAALWAKAKSDIKPEDYTEFYRTLASQYDEPALTIHYRARGKARIFGSGLRAGLEALRSLRSAAQGSHQALRPSRADFGRGRSVAGLAALRPRRGGHGRPTAQRFARDGAAKPHLRRYP